MASSFNDEDKEKVREANDLVAFVSERVRLQQRGREYWGCCPFHQEKTPSFKVDPVTQLWHCFGCGEGGDIFSFVMKADGVSFLDALRMLAERAHIDITFGGTNEIPYSHKARLKKICSQTADFYHTQLMRSPAPQAEAARRYLANRNLGGSIPKRWNLGFAPGNQQLVQHLSQKGFDARDLLEANVATKTRDGRVRDRFFNRIMFPICDAQGDCIAFGGRIVGEGEPKYLNSQETPLFHKSRVLFGLDKAKSSLTTTGVAIIVEGYTDVIALFEQGITNVVATLGTALTLSHVRLLARHAQHKLVYLFDGDLAGQRAADRALQFIDESMTPEAGRNRVQLCAVTLPDNLDPADFIEAHGPDALRKLIDDAPSLVAYGIERRLARHDLSTPEGRTRALTDALSVLAPIKDSLLAKEYALQIATHTHMRESDVLARLAQLKPPRRFNEEVSLHETSSAQTQNPSHFAAAPHDAAYDVKQRIAKDTTQSKKSYAAANQEFAPSVKLPESEVNRLRFEREFLSICAQRPDIALSYADTLAQTQWHDSLHSQLAQSILDTLAADPAASPARIVADAAKELPAASNILTSALRATSAEGNALAAYAAEELALGDMEESIATMRAQLATPEALSPENYELIFESASGLQKTLTELKKSHTLKEPRQESS